MTRRSPPEEPEDDEPDLFRKMDNAYAALVFDPITDKTPAEAMAQGIAVARRYEAATFRDRLAEHFKVRPGEWVNGLDLAKIAGAYAWRSRISDLRTQLGMRIENRQRKHENATISEYRWVP